MVRTRVDSGPATLLATEMDRSQKRALQWCCVYMPPLAGHTWMLYGVSPCESSCEVLIRCCWYGNAHCMHNAADACLYPFGKVEFHAFATHLEVAFQPGCCLGREASWVFKIAGEAECANSCRALACGTIKGAIGQQRVAWHCTICGQRTLHKDAEAQRECHDRNLQGSTAICKPQQAADDPTCVTTSTSRPCGCRGLTGWSNSAHIAMAKPKYK